MEIKTMRMNKKNFVDYGTFIEKANTTQSDEDYTYTRDIVHLKMKTSSIGYLTVYPHEPIYTSLERHKNTSEMLVVLSGQGTILFGKPGDDPNEGLMALRVEAGDTFIMLPSTWHGLITPSECERVDILVMFEKDTEDMDMDVQALREKVMLDF